MHDLISTRRNDVVLDQHLYSIRDRLEKTERTNAVRPVTVLHSPQYLPLQHRDQREEREKHGEQRGNIDQAGNDLNYPARRTGNQGKQQSLSLHEDLIESRTHPREEKRLPLI